MLSINRIINSSTKQFAYNYEIIGTLVDEVLPPSPIDTLVLIDKDSCFALLDTIAIKGQNGAVKWTKGYVLVVVPRELIRDAKTKPSKRLAVGVSGGRLQYALKDDRIVSMYKFKQVTHGGQKVWGLESLQTRPLTRSTDSTVIRLLTDAMQNNWQYNYPEPVPEDLIIASNQYEFRLPDGHHLMNAMYSNQKMSEAVDPESYLKYLESGRNLAVEKVVEQKHIAFVPEEQQPKSPVQEILVQDDTGQLGLPIDNVADATIGIFADNFGNSNNFGVIEPTTVHNLNSRFETIPIPKELEIIRKQLEDGLEKRKSIISVLEEQDKYIKVRDMMIQNVVSGLKNNWYQKVLYKTGRDIFEYLTNKFEIKPSKGMKVKDLLDISYTDAVDSLLSPADGNDFYAQIYENRESYLFGVLEIGLKIRNNRLLDTYFTFKKHDLSFFDTVYNSPFTLSYVCPRLSIEDVEKLGRVMGSKKNEEVKNMRDVAHVRSILLSENNPAINSSTIIEENVLKRLLSSGIPLSKDTVPVVRATNSYLDDEQLRYMQAYIHKDIKNSFFTITEEQLHVQGKSYVLTDGRSIDNLIENFLLSGQGIRVNIRGVSYIGELSLLYKEVDLVYQLVKMNKNLRRELTPEERAQCVLEFEAMKTKEFGFEFKLEDAQKDVLKMIHFKAMILTGQPGSGKTTVAELAIYALTKYYDLDTDSMMFVAPTGKAAMRLKESIKLPTSTIHSAFGLGIGGAGVQWYSGYELQTEGCLLDEASMLNTEVAFESISMLPDNATLLFLGDIDQLPPIGFGKPLYDFLNFLPCVRLNVTKRASDNSILVKNQKKISNPNDKSELEEGSNFVIYETNEVKQGIANMKDILRYHVLGQGQPNKLATDLERVSFDDFQVITPYSNSKSPFGSKALNKEIQELVNPYTTKSILLTMGDEEIEFRLGDRVIHGKKNNREETQYKHIAGNTFEVLQTHGIYNGDTGKIKTIHKTNELVVDGLMEDEQRLLTESKDNEITVVVEYQSIDEKGKQYTYCVFYYTMIVTDNGRHIITAVRDLTMLSLSYALTVHKLQGSQAKLVVLMIPTSYTSNFINMNLVFTAISRTSGVCYYIGTSKGNNSAINRARKINAIEERTSLVSSIYQ